MDLEINSLQQQLRRDVIWSIYNARSGHPGGALSCIDLLAVLFKQVMARPKDRISSYSDDYFILSKGHAAPALYAVAASVGLIKRSTLKLLRKLDSPLQGHPDVKHLPWVEVSTGSLGQGLSVACGIAKGLAMQDKAQRVYTLAGDGEMQEGQVWEAAMFASHHQLKNLSVIIDYNKLQSDAKNEEICAIEPLVDKWRAFGWHAQEIDGHASDAILNALMNTHASKPSVIIAHTVKGKGVEYMENIPQWHGSVTLSDEQYTEAMRALGTSDSELEEYDHV